MRIAVREELAVFLSENGVFRDVTWYVDLLIAQVYADYVSEQGSVYLRADFNGPEDPLMHVRRLLGIDSDAMIRLCFAISGFLAGVSGGLVGLSLSITGPYFGISYGLKALGVLVLGGLEIGRAHV